MKKTDWAAMTFKGPISPELKEVFNDWMQCMRDHEDRYQALMTGLPRFLGMVPKEKTKSTGFKPKKRGKK